MSENPVELLLVEDNPDDVEIVRSKAWRSLSAC